jgi:hypothetical protein
MAAMSELLLSAPHLEAEGHTVIDQGYNSDLDKHLVSKT